MMLPLLEEVVKTQKPLVIVAEDVTGDLLAALIVNKLKGGMNVCARHVHRSASLDHLMTTDAAGGTGIGIFADRLQACSRRPSVLMEASTRT